jgi:hypothetical protein
LVLAIARTACSDVEVTRAWLSILIVAGCKSDPAVAPDAACTTGPLALIETRDTGVVERLHVQIVSQGAPAALLVDTGSPTTFLQEPLGSPDPTPNAGAITLGCAALELDGRPEAADMPVDGLPSIGTFGVDRLLAGPSELDIVGAQLITHAPGQPFTDASAWPAAPFDVVSGLVLAHVTLDGNPVRLMLDTGSQDVLWLGEQPQPGDVEVDTTDALGNPVALYSGTVDLAIGTWHGTVPVLRAPSFPYFEMTVTALGGNVGGLLGLSAIPTQAIVDGESAMLRVNR